MESNDLTNLVIDKAIRTLKKKINEEYMRKKQIEENNTKRVAREKENAR